jgi:hypothetical protein
MRRNKPTESRPNPNAKKNNVEPTSIYVNFALTIFQPTILTTHSNVNAVFNFLTLVNAPSALRAV